jgi:hypothetical protein
VHRSKSSYDEVRSPKDDLFLQAERHRSMKYDVVEANVRDVGEWEVRGRY